MIKTIPKRADIQVIDTNTGKNALHLLAAIGSPLPSIAGTDTENSPTQPPQQQQQNKGKTLRLMKRLIDSGLNVNSTDRDGNTAIHSTYTTIHPSFHLSIYQISIILRSNLFNYFFHSDSRYNI